MGNSEIRDINLMEEIGIRITSSSNGTMILTGPNGEPLTAVTGNPGQNQIGIETGSEDENKLKIRGKKQLRNLFTRTRVSWIKHLVPTLLIH